jgi:hypothetical protein
LAFSGVVLVPHTSTPGMRSNAALTFAKRWSTTASSPYSAARIIHRPSSSSRAIRSITWSGIGPSPSHHCARWVMNDAKISVLHSCGTIRIVSSSESLRSVSAIGARSSSFQARTQIGMYVSG